MRTGKLGQYFAVLVATSSATSLGISYGWPGPVEKHLRDPGGEFHISEEENSWIYSIIEIGNLISSIPGGMLANRYGRKFCLHASTPLFLASWAIVIFTKTKLWLYAMRIIQGLASGIVFTIAPMYLSEISENENRCTILSIFQVMKCVGFVHAAILGPEFSYDVFAILCAVVPAFTFLGFFFIAETPAFYLMQGDRATARRALIAFREEDHPVDQELLAMQETVQANMANKSNFHDLMTDNGNFKALVVVQALTMFKMMTGLNVLMTYAYGTFKTMGISEKNSGYISAVFSVVIVCLAFASARLVDKVGRKPLLLFSAVGCTVTNALLAVYFYFEDKIPVLKEQNWIGFVLVCLLAFYHTVGFGVILSAIQSDYFPANLSGLAYGITGTTITIFSFFSVKSFKTIETHFGMYVNFVVSGTFCALASVFVKIVVFETKGKSFSEINAEFKERYYGIWPSKTAPYERFHS